MAEKLYDVWARRNPNWEKRYEKSIIKNFSDYGKGVTNLGDAKGKLFGAGYEIFIIAFFIGLYYDQRRKLIDDSTKIKSLGQPIQYWGNISKKERWELVDWQTEEEKPYRKELYWKNVLGHFMEDKLIDNPNYFYRETAFLEVFLTFDASTTDSADDEPESLD